MKNKPLTLLFCALLLPAIGTTGWLASARFSFAEREVQKEPVSGEEAGNREASKADSPQDASQEIQVPPPPFSEGIFPCMDCHADLEPNPNRRKLEDFHEDIILRHDEKNRWCLDCHDERDRNRLRLASGKTIPFEESYRLCGQCHGPNLRDWKAGVHGKRTGRWDGKSRRYLLCVHCHNPHHPKFPLIQAMPTPIPPDKLVESLSKPYVPVVLESTPSVYEGVSKQDE